MTARQVALPLIPCDIKRQRRDTRAPAINLCRSVGPRALRRQTFLLHVACFSDVTRRTLASFQGHASQHKAISLKEKMLRAANLVAADATRQSSPKAMAKACGLTNSLDSGPFSAPYDDEGETYLLIRQAFCAAFDELIKQVCSAPWLLSYLCLCAIPPLTSNCEFR